MQNRFQPYVITSISSNVYPPTGEIAFALNHQELCSSLREASLRLKCIALLVELYYENPSGLDEALEGLESIAQFHADIATNK
jgi:hypothetical protein